MLTVWQGGKYSVDVGNFAYTYTSVLALLYVSKATSS